MATPVRIAGGFEFTEGPVWTGDTLLFSDMPANRIYAYRNNTVSVFCEESGFSGGSRAALSRMVGSNALAFDKNGNLLVCKQGDHGIGIIARRGEKKMLYEGYNDRPFNSPNDIIVRSDGAVFFTDPPYGLKDEKLNPNEFQPAAGIYFARGEQVHLLSTALDYPNGVCFSPGEQYLYVGSNAPHEPRLYRCRVSTDGILEEMELFAEENADGMTVDKLGNILLCTMDGLRILSPGGKRIGLVAFPEMLTNCCWGNDDLYLTAEHSLFRLAPPFPWQ